MAKISCALSVDAFAATGAVATAGSSSSNSLVTAGAGLAAYGAIKVIKWLND